jgi:hypothetical protein
MESLDNRFTSQVDFKRWENVQQYLKRVWRYQRGNKNSHNLVGFHLVFCFHGPIQLSSPPVCSGVRVTRSLVLCVCFVDHCLSFCPFSFGHCVVSSSSIYEHYNIKVISSSDTEYIGRCKCNYHTIVATMPLVDEGVLQWVQRSNVVFLVLIFHSQICHVINSCNDVKWLLTVTTPFHGFRLFMSFGTRFTRRYSY